MNTPSLFLFNWLIQSREMEFFIAEKCRIAREYYGRTCPDVLRQWVLGEVRDAPYLQSDIGVNGSILESDIIDWHSIVCGLEDRQNIFEAA
jgi:hypothetical protein